MTEKTGGFHVSPARASDLGVRSSKGRWQVSRVKYRYTKEADRRHSVDRGKKGQPVEVPIMGRSESLQQLRDVLKLRRKALKQALNGDLSMLNDLQEGTKGDLADWASDAAQGEINSQLAEVESRELGSIDAALERINDGTFGVCEGCKSPIPLTRLRALPYASVCVQCKRKLEEHGYKSAAEADWSNILDTGTGDSETSFSDVEI